MSAMFRYIRIKSEDAHFFAGLDPFEKLGVLSLPCGFALGVFYDSVEEIEIAGLMCGTATRESFTIEWMVVDPKFMGMGIGEELLSRAFLMAAVGGIEETSAVIMPEYVKENFTKDAESYFKERLFDTEKEIGSDMDFYLSELYESDFMKGGAKISGITRRPLSDMTGAKRRECIKKLSMKENATYTFDPVDFSAMIDDDISFVALQDGSLKGAILVCRYNDALWPIYLYAVDEEGRDGLIRASVAAAVKKYEKDMPVLITMRQDETSAIVEEIVPPVEKAKLLLASVKDYYKAVGKN